jgi:hypothetical protein
MQMTTNPALESITQREAKEDSDLFSDKAMARAKRIQAHMSFTRADDKAILPSSWFMSFSSARIRASTGNAVTERATPRKRMKVPCVMLCSLLCRRKEKAAPMRKGKIMPERAIAKAFFPVRRITEMSISTPTRKRK